jgi:hypothetical protein
MFFDRIAYTEIVQDRCKILCEIAAAEDFICPFENKQVQI